MEEFYSTYSLRASQWISCKDVSALKDEERLLIFNDTF